MSERSELTLELLIVVFVLALVTLILVALHRRQINRIAAQLAASLEVKAGEDLKRTVEDQQEMTRAHISASVASIAHETEMNKGLLHRLFAQYDKLVQLLIRALTPK